MTDAISWLLIFLALADWGASVILVRAALAIRGAALEERATTAVVLTIGATAASVLAIANLTGQRFPDAFVLLLLTAALVALSVPQLVWSGAYLMGRFR